MEPTSEGFCSLGRGRESIPASSALRRFVWNLTFHVYGHSGAGIKPRTWVKAGRRPTEGLGLDVGERRSALAKGLSDKEFLAGKPDGRGRLAAFPLAGRAGGWVVRTRDNRPPQGNSTP